MSDIRERAPFACYTCGCKGCVPVYVPLPSGELEKRTGLCWDCHGASARPGWRGQATDEQWLRRRYSGTTHQRWVAYDWKADAWITPAEPLKVSA